MPIPRQRLLRRIVFAVLAAGAAIVFTGTVLHHLLTFDLRPLAALGLPVLAVFFTFTSLLYLRGRSLAAGRDQWRTLFAAEAAMQATVFYLTGILSGIALYGVLQEFGVDLERARSAWTWVALSGFVLPYVLMQAGLLLLVRAAAIIAPQFLRVVRPHEVWQRIGSTA